MRDSGTNLQTFHCVGGGSTGLQPSRKVTIDMTFIVAVEQEFSPTSSMTPNGCRIYICDGPGNGYHVDSTYEDVVRKWQEVEIGYADDDLV